MFLLIKYFFIAQIGGSSLVFLYKTQINDDTGSAYQSRPIVYFGEDSMIYVVFEDDRDKDNLREIYFSKSSDLGRTFSPNILLSPNLDRDDYFPWIAVSPQGEIYVVWQSVKGVPRGF